MSSLSPVVINQQQETQQIQKKPPCEDISEFLDLLKKMRVLDDKITHALNTSIPTESFSSKVNASTTCKNLYTSLTQNYANRDKTLKNCLNFTVTRVKELRTERDANFNDVQILKKLRKEQSKLRELETEIDVEEVIRARTLKLFSERCRSFYKPEDA